MLLKVMRSQLQTVVLTYRTFTNIQGPSLPSGIHVPPGFFRSPIIRTFVTQTGRSNNPLTPIQPKVRKSRKRLIIVAVSLTAGLGYAYFSKSPRREDVCHPAKDWQVSLYRFLPWKSLSRFWGWINGLELPVPLRKPVLGLYAKVFNCNLGEAEVEDLREYKNLGEFFRRRLKEGARPINSSSVIVAPADGKILNFGRVDCGKIEQIKGITYSLAEFIGPPTWLQDPKSQAELDSLDESTPLHIPSDPAMDPNLLYDCAKYHEFITENRSGSALYHFVIYLAPGDYHCFHVPTDWRVKYRRHFAGDLLSVNPEICSLVRGLFNINERVVYMGEWKHGFFSMAAIGATNVGSIKIYADEDLQTNALKVINGSQFDKSFRQPVPMKKGDIFGEFNLGSTIVLIFEAPSNLEFCVNPGDPIRVGQPILASAQL